MLLTILILGGAMMSASLIAGFLTLQSIRQSTLSSESAKAIFAADAGIDYMFYKCRQEDSSGALIWCVNPVHIFSTCGCDAADPDCEVIGTEFSNGSCYIAKYQKDVVTGEYIEMSSVEYSNINSKLVARALHVTF